MSVAAREDGETVRGRGAALETMMSVDAFAVLTAIGFLLPAVILAWLDRPSSR